MAIRLKHILAVQASRDTAGRKKLFYQDTEVEAVTIDTFDHIQSGNLSIPPGDEESLGFGQVNQAKGLFLEVSGDCNLTLNGAATPIPLEVSGSTAKFFIEATLTSIQIENTSAEDTLTGVYALWGMES